jgi:hypothetical protein
MSWILNNPNSKEGIEILSNLLDDLANQSATDVQSLDKLLLPTLIVKNENTKKANEARYKILTALEDSDLGFKELQKKAGVSSSTLHSWLPKLQKQQLVISAMALSSGKKLYRLNKALAIPVAAVSVPFGRGPVGSPYPIVRLRRGQFGTPRTIELTDQGRQVVEMARKVIEYQGGKRIGADGIVDRLLWAGLRSITTVELVVAGEPNYASNWPTPLNGTGNCPRCHNGMMREVQLPSHWHCPNCGANRGGTFKPEPQNEASSH